ncbi:DUF4843 domain-containing protein [Sphingobacterium yanglingense]|uniref:Uncharacterized protein DUF4843 n=1 Tax=Sphingobacterium yanglingense TaxID=1437280 RepID=A0A4V3DE13_9SPHI|nr:DUF4843 domain-containing protein [Sphingobacterium yanglingense]TDQ79219.1 uncharacterized protein DUF4843 [Sphingobacterium yanglingense]
MYRCKLIISSFFLSLFIFFGCKKNEQDPFFNGATALSISGDAKQGAVGDSLVFSFGVLNSDVTDTLIKLHMRAIGAPVDQDRQFVLSVNSQLSDAQSDEYEIEKNFIIPANSLSAIVPIRIKRSARTESASATLVMDVSVNENFIPGPKLEIVGQPTSGPRFTLRWTSQLTKPAAWDDFPYAALYFCLGEYSTAKHQIIIDATGITTYDDVMAVSDRWYYIYNKCLEWLNTYNQAHPDAPLRDENGDIVEFPIF